MRVSFACADACDASTVTATVTLNGVPVTDGETVRPSGEGEAELIVTCEDGSGNVARASVQDRGGPQRRHSDRP